MSKIDPFAGITTKKAVPIAELSDAFSAVLKEAVEKVNINFALRELSKLPRNQELLPTDTRLLSSYRTRIGTMLEYAICSAVNEIITKRYNDKIFFTFVSAHQYPDFHLRNKEREILARVEMKAIDAESDEQAARFDVATHLVNPAKDLLFILGWKWKDIVDKKGKVYAECPSIFASLVIPAGELAAERDARLAITGGKIVDGEVMVYSKRTGKFVPDPGNYGKFWRIIHRSRIAQKNPNPTISAFLKFLEEVGNSAPKNRFVLRKDRPKADPTETELAE
ncbi:MAG: hypothetical protein AAB518_02975 [Patescibacteria group bacterium]